MQNIEKVQTIAYTNKAANVHAEQLVLSTLIVYPELANKIRMGIVTEEHFTLIEHKEVFKLLQDTLHKHDTLETELIVSELENTKHKVSLDLLIMLIDNSAAKSSFDYYLNILVEKKQERDLIELSNETRQKLLNQETPSEIIFEIQEQLTEIAKGHSVHDIETSREVAMRVYHKILSLQMGEIETEGVKTGYKTLDGITNGFQSGELIILAARPSMGKTALALNWLMTAAQNGNNVLMFSLEMENDLLMQRLLSASSKVRSDVIRKASFDNHEGNALSRATNMLAQQNIFLNDNSAITVPEIYSKALQVKEQHGLDMIIIDYMQLIDSASRTENRQQEVSKISRQLKQLARELEIPVIALSQLSRAVEQREDKRPQLSDLRESGSIEQDADIVMFLYREAYYLERKGEELDDYTRKKTELIIRKHRMGRLATIEMAFEPEYSLFREVGETYD